MKTLTPEQEAMKKEALELSDTLMVLGHRMRLYLHRDQFHFSNELIVDGCGTNGSITRLLFVSDKLTQIK